MGPDFSIITDVIKEFLEDFGKNYAKAYTVALINKAMEAESSHDDNKESYRLLTHYIPVPPEMKGKVSVSLNGGSKTKTQYWKVNNEWNIEIWNKEEDSKAAEAEEDEKKRKKPKELWVPWNYNCYRWSPPGKEFPKRRGGPEWQPDAEGEACKKCEAKFTMMKRRHHCRTCGQIFCQDCCGEKWPLFDIGYSEAEKVCDGCFEILNTQGLEAFVFPEVKQTYGLSFTHTQRAPKFMLLDSQKDADEWLSAVRSCARYSSAPVNPNPLLAYAFAAAHKFSWNRQGPWWKWWKVFGDENEMMSALLSFIVRERCMDRLVSDVPAFGRRKMKEKARGTIEVMVSKAIEKGWPVIVDAVALTEEPILTAITPILSPIGEAKQKIIDSMRTSISGAIAGALDATANPLIDKILPMAFGPMLNVHIQCYKVLKTVYDDVKEEVNSYETTNERQFHWRVRHVSYRVYYRTYEIADAELDPMVDMLRALGSVPPFCYLWPRGLYWLIIDSARSLLQDALYTTEKDQRLIEILPEGGAAVSEKLTGLYPELVQKYFEDSKTVVKETMVKILWQLIGTPIIKTVLEAPGVSDILTAANDLIPDDLKDFLSIDDMVLELLNGVVEDTIQKAVEENTGNCMDKLEAGYNALA